MTEIVELEIRKILDSRGNPTVEVDVATENGFGTAAAPSGASTGKSEVVPFPEGGIEAAIDIFYDEIVPELRGMDALYQRDIDTMLHEIDGTENFSHIGGSVAVATSLAVAKAAASALEIPLYYHLGGGMKAEMPRPFGNVIGGGVHAVGGTSIQEFLSVAMEGTMEERVFANAEVHKRIKCILKDEMKNIPIGKGDEGAWIAPVEDTRALEILVEAISAVSEEMGVDIYPALDVAASSLYDPEEDVYVYRDRKLSPGEQIDFIVDLIETYELISVEDPLHEEDFSGFAELTKKVGSKALIVGDDLFTTNKVRLEKGIREGAANAILIKPNQIGTLTDTFETMYLAHKHGYKTIVSHRSGETTDETIAHIAVAFNAYGIKTGAVGGERIAKLNELIRIEEKLI